jgi:uncharacterized oxidoreductase
MPIVTETRLRAICQQILLALHTPADIAETVARILVEADIKGVDSHGCRLLHMYLRLIGSGAIVPGARPDVIQEEGAIVRLEGNWSFGQMAASLAAGRAIELARKHGIGAASLVHVQHIGRVGEYAEQIARAQMLGIVMCHASRVTTPYGGMQRVFGTNPIALAAPRQNGKVLAADFATSSKSVNRLMIYRQRAWPVPDDVILDKDGYATNDPDAFFDGGVLLPVGGYKGYALNLFIDIIGGILVGAGCASLIDKHPGNGTLLIALDIARWRSLDDFAGELEQLLAVVKSAKIAPEFEEVLLPGELEDRAEAQRRRKGIPIDQETWKQLHEVVDKVGLPASLLSK